MCSINWSGSRSPIYFLLKNLRRTPLKLEFFGVLILSFSLSFILISFSSPALAWDEKGDLGNQALKWVTRNQWLQNQAMQMVLKQRCNHYLKRDKSFWKRRDISKQCRQGARDFKEQLNAQVVNKDPITASVVFPELLEHFLDNKKVYFYLDQLESEFESIYHSPTRFNLWNFTQDIFKDKDLSILMIAALFQDISSTQIHLYWLNKKVADKPHEFSTVYLENLRRLQKVTDEITLWTQGYTQKPSNFEFYPPGSLSNEGYGNVQLYHYYVPSAIAVVMEQHQNSSLVSFFIPFMFNYLYEVFRGDEILERLYSEPQDIKHHGTLKDIFLGYEGSLFGVKTNFETWSAESFFHYLGSNPEDFLQTLFSDLESQELRLDKKKQP